MLVICRGIAFYRDQNLETVGTLSRSGPGFLAAHSISLMAKIVSSLRPGKTGVRPGKTGVGGLVSRWNRDRESLKGIVKPDCIGT